MIMKTSLFSHSFCMCAGVCHVHSFGHALFRVLYFIKRCLDNTRLIKTPPPHPPPPHHHHHAHILTLVILTKQDQQRTNLSIAIQIFCSTLLEVFALHPFFLIQIFSPFNNYFFTSNFSSNGTFINGEKIGELANIVHIDGEAMSITSTNYLFWSWFKWQYPIIVKEMFFNFLGAFQDEIKPKSSTMRLKFHCP